MNVSQKKKDVENDLKLVELKLSDFFNDSYSYNNLFIFSGWNANPFEVWNPEIITITQNYIQSGFNNKKIDYLNKDLGKKHRKKY